MPGTGNLKPSAGLAGLTVGFGGYLGQGGMYLGVEADGDYDFMTQSVGCAMILNCKERGSFLLTQRAIVGLPGLGSPLPQLGNLPAVPAPSNWPVPINLPTTITGANIMPYATGGIAERLIKAGVLGQGEQQDWLWGPAVGGGVRLPITPQDSLDMHYLFINYNKSFVPACSACTPLFAGSAFKAATENVVAVGWQHHF